MPLLTTGVGGYPTAGGGGGGAMSIVLTVNTSWLTGPVWGTPTSTESKVGTMSFWIKLVGGLPPVDGFLYEGSPYSHFEINGGAGGEFLYSNDHASNTVKTQEFITDANWHHLCYMFDSTQATAANRTKISLDGVPCTYDSGSTYIAQNASFELADSGTAHIGDFEFVHAQSFNGKIAYWHYVAGQALPASSFTTGTGAGSIHPITYAGTYGTNGFKLDFSGSNTNDQSGNGLNWTQVGGPTFDTDVPT